MPPPHFSTATGGPSHQPQSTSAFSTSDLPKPHRYYARDALQSIQLALSTEDEVASQSASLKAFQAIQKLVDSPELQHDGENELSKTTFPRTRVMSNEIPSTSAGTPGEGSQMSLGKLVSTVVDASLFNFFSDEMDQDSHSRRQLLISFLYAMRPILDPRCVVLEWWDVLLRPMLKNPHCNVSVSRKAQLLVIWAMSATPSSAYVDEPSPTAVWPPADQSATVAAASSPRSGRKPGDAPYPASSTRSFSQSRSSEDGDARVSALFSTPSKRNGPPDPLRRFTQRIFDLYTSEASSASLKTVEDDEIRDIEESEEEEEEGDEGEGKKQKTAGNGNGKDGLAGLDLDLVGPTWKGNLEAIILTFGEERPKPFFHHLSESFIEPQSRVPILLLLTIFFRLSSLYAYHVVATPFVRLLVLSLQLDTSKTSTSLGVLALVTLVPHFPNWLASGGAGGLPALLSIYARIVDWRKLIPGWEEGSNRLDGPRDDEVEEWKQVERISRRLQLRKGLDWKRLESSYDAAQSQLPNAEMLFTILYGIFPCNVIRFLRAPIDYLRKAEYQSPFLADWSDIIDESAVQHKSAAILKHHILHPALIEMDAEREISDTQRWNEHDTASTTADCASLYVGNGDLSTSSSFMSALHAMDGRGMQLRSFSGSSFGADLGPISTINKHVGRAANLSDELNGSSQDQAPSPRFFRQRSVSESLGRSGRHTLQSSLVNNTFTTPQIQSKKRDSSVHFSPLQSRDSSTFTSPRLPSTWDRRYPDDNLRNHVALRSGTPLPGMMRIGSSNEGTGRSNSIRSSSSSVVRSFHPPQTTLSSVMSPSRSNGPTSGLAHSVNPDFDPVSSSSNNDPDEMEIRSRSTSSAVSPPPINATLERPLLGSPALSFGPVSTAVKKAKVSYLKQENLQLRNELNYEIGQKDQLLRHIGTIHRNRVKDTVLEEELQNLYHLVRSQKLQLKSLREELEVSKAEGRQSKSRQANWQAELTAKLKSMREEKKAWGNEVRTLKIVQEDREELIDKLERQLDENAGELFELREKVKSDVKKVEAIQEYEEKISKLETCLRFWNDDMKVFEKQNGEMKKLLNRWEEMSMLVEASEGESKMNLAKMEILEREKEQWQQRAEESKEVIAQLTSTRGVNKIKEKVFAANAYNVSSSPALSAASGRGGEEEGEKMRMKKRIEELEAHLLDAKVREEQWKMAAVARTQSKEQQDESIRSKEEGSTSNGIHTLLSEHDIAPLQLGEAVEMEGQRQGGEMNSTVQ